MAAMLPATMARLTAMNQRLSEDLRAGLLELSAVRERPRVDGREADLLDQGGDARLRAGVVAGEDDREPLLLGGGAPAG